MPEPTGPEYQDYLATLERAIAEGRPAQAAKMFGMPSIKAIGGKAVAGFFEGDMVFKLSGQPHARALAIPGAALFDPMGGRPMKQWVQVPYGSKDQWHSLLIDALACAETF